MTEVGDRLRDALEDGSAEALAAWAATGQRGLVFLRETLIGRTAMPPLDQLSVHPKDALDNLTDAVAEIARAHQAAFLDVFSDERLDADSLVVVGLSEVDDPRATRRLVAAARSADRWVRMDAAIGLGRRQSIDASDALEHLLDDSEYLVRYHALRSIASVGGHHALARLRAIQFDAPVEAALTADAIAAITARVSD
jgi:HEAT repeat protein